jgi:hypothetical protein
MITCPVAVAREGVKPALESVRAAQKDVPVA